MRGFQSIAASIALAGCATAPTIKPAMGDGVNVPKFEASARCPDIPEAVGVNLPYGREQICGQLEKKPKDRIEAPPGVRVYRETWESIDLREGGNGSILLTIYPDGRRTLESTWARGKYTLKSRELPDFEATLAKSRFAELPLFVEPQIDREGGNDIVCLDGVPTSLEAIVDGKYRLVFFTPCGGVFLKDVAAALDQLFLFAVKVSGGKHPFDPEHPTWSW